MALDEALIGRARGTGEWVLRVYSWSRPTISLGRNQLARERYDLAAIRDLGLDVVRRPTGGRAILHDREVTYSVTGPVAEAGDLRQSYDRINRLLLQALRSMGVKATVATSGGRRALSPGMAPCFAEPAPGELTLAGRKLAGSAQCRVDGALLQHGSILLADDQSVLATLAVGEDTHGRKIPAPATLGDALGRTPPACEVFEALTAAVRQLEDRAVKTLSIDDGLRAQSLALVVRYLDEAWTWRR
jgi:lipoate-protein ligase A